MAAAPSQTWRAGEPDRPQLHRLADAVGELEALDPIAERTSSAVRDAVPAGPVKDAISGTWLGHALHPLLTDIPIGSWTSATVLDVVGGRDARGAAERLIGVGLAAALPTALTGMNDWADTTMADDGVKRIGAVHAAANIAATVLYGGSLAARRRGRHGGGVFLGLAGIGVLALGGHLGGHLSYAKGVGVDQTVFEDEAADWTPTVAEAELEEDTPRRVDVAGVDVLLVRRAGRVFALSNRCTHRGGPLDQGSLEDGCVRCPWHGSVFRLDDGAVVRGPAGAPQPAWDVRVEDGTVEVRIRSSAAA